MTVEETTTELRKLEEGEETHDNDDEITASGQYIVSEITAGTGVTNLDTDTDWGKRKKYSINVHSIRLAMIAAIGGLLWGWDMGSSYNLYSEGFEHFFRISCPDYDEECVPREDNASFHHYVILITTTGLSSIIGASFIAPYLFDRKGRRITMFTGGVLVLVGSFIEAISFHLETLYVAHFFEAAGIGVLNMCVPAYLSEIAQIHNRGRFVITWQLGITTGFLIVSFINIWLVGSDNEFSWRYPFIMDIFLALIFLALMKFLPESPHFLVMQGRNEDARAVLKEIRSEIGEVEYEIRELRMEAKLAKKIGGDTSGCLRLLDNSKKGGKMLQRLILGILMMAFQECTGIQAIEYFMENMAYYIDDHKGPGGGALAVFLLGLIDFIATFFTLTFIESFGRPFLFLCGSLVMTVAISMMLVVELAVDDFGTTGKNPSTGDVVFFLLLAATFMGGYSFAWEGVTYLYCVELFDIRTRGVGVGITWGCYWLCDTLMQLYLELSDVYLPEPTVLAGFMVVCALSMPFVYFFVPETANRTPIEFGEEFVNFKPKCVRMNWGPLMFDAEDIVGLN